MSLQKNVAGQKWRVFAFNITTGAAVTGDAANITAKIAKDWAGAGATNDVNPTEVEDGYYVFDLTQAESNADALDIYPESSTGSVQVVGVPGSQTTRVIAAMRGTDNVVLAGPTEAQMNARTIAAAAYFDPATDTVALVTTLTNQHTLAAIQAELEQDGASLLDTIRDELANGADGLTALKTAIDAIPTVMVGTDGALTDKVDFSLSTVGILAIWHQLTSAVVTASTMGLVIKQIMADWANAGRLDDILDARASQTTADAIEVDTQNIQGRLPATLIGGRVDASMGAIIGNEDAAVRFEALMDASPLVQVNGAGATLTTAVIDGFVSTRDDQFKGRLITVGDGTFEQTDITGYIHATQTITFTALTAAPANDVFLSIS